MTGPEHYLEAERLLVLLDEWKAVIGTNLVPPDVAATIDRAATLTLALAQVHATLAQAAATAMSGHSSNGMHAADYNAWDDLCGIPADDD